MVSTALKRATFSPFKNGFASHALRLFWHKKHKTRPSGMISCRFSSRFAWHFYTFRFNNNRCEYVRSNVLLCNYVHSVNVYNSIVACWNIIYADTCIEQEPTCGDSLLFWFGLSLVMHKSENEMFSMNGNGWNFTKNSNRDEWTMEWNVIRQVRSLQKLFIIDGQCPLIKIQEWHTLSAWSHGRYSLWKCRRICPLM